MSGESFPNTQTIDEGQSGPDDGGYAHAMESGDSEQVERAMDAVHDAQDDLRGLATQPLNVAEGTKFGVDEKLEAEADKILAEANNASTSNVTETPAVAPTIPEAPVAEAPAPAVAETPTATPVAETPVAEAKPEQQTTVVQAPISPENTNINLGGDNPEAKSAEKKIECFLPDGSHFTGTPEEYNQAVQDYLENIRDLM